MKVLSISLLAIGILAIGSCNSPGNPKNPEAEKAALEAANNWLKLVDDRNYDRSWQEAASYFKTRVPQAEWERTMKSQREPFGNNISRSLKSKQYRTSLPGVPDGEYVVIQYQSSFDNKKFAIETVTPMLDRDGKWRVSGYFIK
ncbi:MAG: DUF4019 domain-containing protein [Prochloraceae cyanobacterium]|nr:DUF4019 domain-containing protein [Prochloraceae cyanobacterium]